jgi:hypothetical protein
MFVLRMEIVKMLLQAGREHRLFLQNFGLVDGQVSKIILHETFYSLHVLHESLLVHSDIIGKPDLVMVN